jgi:hypothetical protein
METIESLKAEIARLKSSWHVETLVRKDAIIAKQEAENDRLKAELTAQQSPAVAVPEFNGWYCAQCQCGVDPSEVTYRETHTACGRYITDDEPPTPSQRVTEQDARKIYESAVNKRNSLTFGHWLELHGRALLAKLNGVAE